MTLAVQRAIKRGVLAVSLCAAASAAEPGAGPSLTNTAGTIYRPGTLSALKSAFSSANAAGVPATILVSNGTYVLDTWALPVTCDQLIVRSLSGDRDAVVIRGPDEGPSASVEHIFWVQANTVTVADITFGWCRYHGVQAHGQSPVDVSGLRVHNCRIVNCNEQFIKGTSSDGDPEGVTDGRVEYCTFEFTNGWAYQYYTGGIDVHKGVNWIVRDNVFRNIRTPNDESGYAEHAVHFWKRCTTRPQNIVVERNVIVHCDRGIGFGLGGWADGMDGGGSVIRNNTVYNNGDGDWTDVGIGLESACDVLVDNNTVLAPYWAPIEYRFSGSSNLVFRNNLVNANITARDGAPAAARSNNVSTAQASWFRDAASGDLHLLPGTSAAIDQGCAVPEFNEDIDGHRRPAGAAWDVGADEYDAHRTDTDGDIMTDAWESAYGLDPENPADASGNGDGDAFNNREEFIALTHPGQGGSYFRSQGVGIDSGLSVRVACSTSRVYTLYRTESLTLPDWSAVSGQIRIPGDASGTLTLTDSSPPSRAAYRLRVSFP